MTTESERRALKILYERARRNIAALDQLKRRIHRSSGRGFPTSRYVISSRLPVPRSQRGGMLRSRPYIQQFGRGRARGIPAIRRPLPFNGRGRFDNYRYRHIGSRGRPQREDVAVLVVNPRNNRGAPPPYPRRFIRNVNRDEKPVSRNTKMSSRSYLRRKNDREDRVPQGGRGGNRGRGGMRRRGGVRNNAPATHHGLDDQLDNYRNGSKGYKQRHDSKDDVEELNLQLQNYQNKA